MLIEVKKEQEGETVGWAYECDGCGAVTRRKKKASLQVGWVEKTEPRYGNTGNRVYGGGMDINVYCPGCQTDRVTAATGAAERRKLHKRHRNRAGVAKQEDSNNGGGASGVRDEEQ